MGSTPSEGAGSVLDLKARKKSGSRKTTLSSEGVTDCMEIIGAKVQAYVTPLSNGGDLRRADFARSADAFEDAWQEFPS